MKSIRIRPSKLSGTLFVPPSKSQTLRALLFASLAKGRSRIYNYLHSPDTFAMIEACKLLGAKVTRAEKVLEVIGVDGQVTLSGSSVNAGNSGIVLRFIAAAAALGSGRVSFTGDHSIQTKRPMRPLLNALEMLGAEVGYDPYSVSGPLTGTFARLDGQDSQPVSALLIASAFRKGVTTLVVENPGELPWVELTLHWLRRLGIRFQNERYQRFEVEGGSPEGFEYVVPADLSSLSFPVAAALVTGSELTVKGIDWSDPQGDKALFATLQKMGAQLDFGVDSLHIRPESLLVGREIDINAMIDTVCILAVLGCSASGATRLTGASIARQKECDRLACSALELSKMGAILAEEPAALTIRQSALSGAHVEAHGDHRLAMALAVAALGAEGETEVLGAECIEKTYPTFVEDFQQLGADISWHQIPSDASFAAPPGESPTAKRSASSLMDVPQG